MRDNKRREGEIGGGYYCTKRVSGEKKIGRARHREREKERERVSEREGADSGRGKPPL